MHPPLRLQNPLFSHCHASIQRTVFTFVPWLVCTGSWTQQEFLLSGQTAPVTPDGVPLSEHASFLPPEDSFVLDVDELRSQLPRSSSSSARGKPVALRVATTSSEWHAFGGGVPLVRQHSQGASRRGSSPVPSLLFPRHHISRSTSPTPPCALALTAPLTAPAPRRAELQCMVQTAFDEMEAALALGRKNCPQACAEGHQRGEPAAGTNT